MLKLVQSHVFLGVGDMASGMIEVAALGRPFTVGMLYNAWEDQLIPGKMVGRRYVTFTPTRHISLSLPKCFKRFNLSFKTNIKFALTKETLDSFYLFLMTCKIIW